MVPTSESQSRVILKRPSAYTSPRILERRRLMIQEDGACCPIAIAVESRSMGICLRYGLSDHKRLAGSITDLAERNRLEIAVPPE